eukprot:COSAG02_NODE_2661_length_8306_cov_942.235287_7_plen_118_part_00
MHPVDIRALSSRVSSLSLCVWVAAPFDARHSMGGSTVALSVSGCVSVFVCISVCVSLYVCVAVAACLFFCVCSLAHCLPVSVWVQEAEAAEQGMGIGGGRWCSYSGTRRSRGGYPRM